MPADQACSFDFGYRDGGKQPDVEFVAAFVDDRGGGLVGDYMVDREGKVGAVLFDSADRQQENGGSRDLVGDFRAGQIFVAAAHDSDGCGLTWKKLSWFPWGSAINTLR